MSMSCVLSRVTQEQVRVMRADPAVVADLLSDVDALPEQPGFFARLFGKTEPAPALRRRALPWIGADRQYDLDRQWQILHFLLTGSVEGGEFPAAFICNDGEHMGEDGGYGRPRLFTSAQARQIADHLAGIDAQELVRRYRADAITAQGVYWQVPDSAEEQREDALLLWETMDEVARFVDETARLDCGLVVEIW